MNSHAYDLVPRDVSDIAGFRRHSHRISRGVTRIRARRTRRPSLQWPSLEVIEWMLHGAVCQWSIEHANDRKAIPDLGLGIPVRGIWRQSDAAAINTTYTTGCGRAGKTAHVQAGIASLCGEMRFAVVVCFAFTGAPSDPAFWYMQWKVPIFSNSFVHV